MVCNICLHYCNHALIAIVTVIEVEASQKELKELEELIPDLDSKVSYEK